MIRLRHKLLIQVFRWMDQAVLFLTLASIILFGKGLSLVRESIQQEPITIFALPALAIGWFLTFRWWVRYRADRLTKFTAQIRELLAATTMASFWLVLVSAMFSIGSINIPNLLVFWSVISIYCVLSRFALRSLLAVARKGGYNYRYLVIIGANEKGRDMAEQILASKELGFRIRGFVAESDEAREAWETQDDAPAPVLGMLGDLRAILSTKEVDEVMVCLQEDSRFSDVTKIIKDAKDLGIVVRLVPAMGSQDFFRALRVEEFGGECILTLFREQMLLQLLLKRVVDVVGASVALVLLSPIMVAAAIAVRRTSPGPMLFVQERVGMNGRRFKLYKFRSMYIDAEARKQELMHLNERDGPVFKIEDDPRITPVGRFIRSTSIDELPQLVNVLKGEMSLVGPRPPTPDEVEKYEWLYHKRLSVKPGLTCVWQVSGRKNISFQQWMEMDKEYIENWSVWLDFKILFKTVPVVLMRRGSS